MVKEVRGKSAVNGLGPWDKFGRSIGHVRPLSDPDEHLRLAVQVASVGVWDLDLQTGEVYCSPECRQQIGYLNDEVEFVTRDWHEYMHPDDLQWVLLAAQAFLAAPSEKCSAEFRLRHKDGAYRWIFAQGSLVYDENHQPARLIGATIDITQRKEAEEALRENEASFRAFADALPEPALLMRLDGTVILANQAMARNFGLQASDLVGRCIFELLPPEVAALRKEWVEVARKSRKAECFEDRNGDRRFLNYFTPVIDGNGIVNRIAVIGFNITQQKLAEEALHRSEALFRAIVEDQNDMIVRWKPDGTQTFVNAAYCRTYGQTYDALVGTKFDAFFSESEREKIRQKVKELTPEKPITMGVLRSIGPKGEALWQEWIARGLFDTEGQLVEVQSTGRDVTGRIHSERRIRQLNAVYAVLSEINQLILREGDLKQLLNAACRIAVDKGGFRLAWISFKSKTADKIELFAYAGMSAEKVPAIDRLLGNSEKGCPVTWTVLQTGKHAVSNDIAAEPSLRACYEVLNDENCRSVACFPIKVEDNVVGTLHLFSNNLGFFDDEELRLLNELALDIGMALHVNQRETERRSAEMALRESQRQLERAQQVGHIGSWVADVDGRLTMSAEAYRILGLDPSEAEGSIRSFIEFVHPEDRAAVRAAGDAAMANLRRYAIEHRIVRRDGQIRWVYAQADVESNSNGEGVRLIGVGQDITERRLLEDQLRQSQKMEAIGHLSGAIAHDFNNILAAMLMQAEVASTVKDLPDEVQESLVEIRKSAERAANLTRQLLVFSRRQVMQRKLLDVNDSVTNLARMLQRVLGTDIRLQLHLHPEALPIRADAGMLDQVLLNLAVNARDAMPRGGCLTIETSKTFFDVTQAATMGDVAPGNYVCLQVIDTGEGIRPEIMPHIFEPFFTTKELGKGTGLGLATVFGIVKQHQGWLDVKSETGQGAAFRIFLPANTEHGTSSGTRVSALQPRGGAETILLVEDEPAVRKIARLVLARAGYRVIEAGNGQAALDAWEMQTPKPDLVLTDLVMPGGMHGQQLGRQLSALAPGLKIIYMSGYSQEYTGGTTDLRPGENFLQKPFTQDNLLATIRRALDA